MGKNNDWVFNVVLSAIVGWTGYSAWIWWQVKDKPKGANRDEVKK